MRKKLLIATALFVIACSLNARSAENSVKLYADPDRSQQLVIFHSPFTEFDIWVWWKPDTLNGMTGGDVRIVCPSNVVPGAVVSNPLIVEESGTLNSGILFTVDDSNCQYDWFWSHRQSCVLIDSTPRFVRVWPSIGNDRVEIISCEPGHPTYLASVSYLFVNAYIASKETSWGAIKNCMASELD